LLPGGVLIVGVLIGGVSPARVPPGGVPPGWVSPGGVLPEPSVEVPFPPEVGAASAFSAVAALVGRAALRCVASPSDPPEVEEPVPEPDCSPWSKVDAPE
jgi:hypothetical protein